MHENTKPHNLERLWSQNPTVQSELRKAISYTGKLALLANRTGTASPFSLNSLKINRHHFSGKVNFIDISNGLERESLLTHRGFRTLAHRAETRQARYTGPQIGSALEMFFMDISHIIFGAKFQGEITSVLDDLDYQTDAFFLEQPFSKTRFLFGLDFTINPGDNIQKDTGAEKKIRQIIESIRTDPDRFNIIYAYDSKENERFSAKNVPKLVCFISGSVLEQMAKLYYELDHDGLEELSNSIRVEIIESLAMQAYIFAKYAKRFNNPGMLASYYKLYRILKQMTKKEHLNLNRQSSVVGPVDRILHDLNPKRAVKASTSN